MRYVELENLPAIVHPSRAGFKSWLEQQPAKRGYNWNLPCDCVVGLYLREACGIPDPIALHHPEHGYELLIGEDYYRIAQTEPWTMGAALRRM